LPAQGGPPFPGVQDVLPDFIDLHMGKLRKKTILCGHDEKRQRRGGPVHPVCRPRLREGRLQRGPGSPVAHQVRARNQRHWMPAFAGMTPTFVTPAKAVVHLPAWRGSRVQRHCLPASAGMTPAFCHPRERGGPAPCLTREQGPTTLSARFRGYDTDVCHPRERGGPAPCLTWEQRPTTLSARFRGHDNKNC